MFDYAPVIATAKKLIKDFGRQAAFQKLSSTPVDSNKPWNGPGTPVVSETQNLDCVFVPAQGLALGKDFVSEDLLKQVSQVALVSPTINNLEAFHTVVDGGVTYKIKWVQVLKPANDIVLYAVGVNQ